MLKFYYNGIKENGGKLQGAHYSLGNLTNYPADTITIYNRSYVSFTKEIHEAFAIENQTDLMTDYFDKDRIRVLSSHPLYAQVKAAYEAGPSPSRKAHCKAYGPLPRSSCGLSN